MYSKMQHRSTQRMLISVAIPRAACEPISYCINNIIGKIPVLHVAVAAYLHIGFFSPYLSNGSFFRKSTR